MKTALRFTLAMACALIAPCAAAQNIFPESTDPRWAPLEEVFLVPYKGELPKLAPPKTARLWQPYLRKDSEAKICDEALDYHVNNYLGKANTPKESPRKPATFLHNYTQVSLFSLYFPENRDPKTHPWTGPEVETHNIYHDWGNGPRRFGQIIRFKDRPNDIFFHHRVYGSWRGDTGGYYRFDASTTDWEVLKSDLSTLDNMRKYFPKDRSIATLSDTAIFHRSFEAYVNEKSITLNEAFVLSDLKLIWDTPETLYFIAGQGRVNEANVNQIFDGGINRTHYNSQSICEVAIYNNRVDIRYDRIGYFDDGRNLDAVVDPEILDAPLRRYFERVAQMVGHGHGQGGTMRSYSRNIAQGRAQRQGFLTRPWAFTSAPIAGGYSEDTAEKLRRWSYQDAWSRHVYLDALSRYDVARSEAADYLSSAYSGPVPRAQDYAQNALTSITKGHFWFDVNGLWRAGVFGETNPNIPSIYEGTISLAHYGTVLEKARADAALTAISGTPQRNSFRSIATLHDYLTATFWHDDLFGAYIEGGYDVNAPNRFGKTPLMVAAHLDFDRRAKQLIAAGADIHAAIPKKTEGQRRSFPKRPRTALDYALENGSWETIYALMDAGARRAEGSKKHLSTKALLELNPNLSDYGRAYIAGELAFRSP